MALAAAILHLCTLLSKILFASLLFIFGSLLTFWTIYHSPPPIIILVNKYFSNISRLQFLVAPSKFHVWTTNMYDYLLQVTTYISLIGSNRFITYIYPYTVFPVFQWWLYGAPWSTNKLHKWFYIKVRNVSADQYRKCHAPIYWKSCKVNLLSILYDQREVS
jgi:hypothetical protein